MAAMDFPQHSKQVLEQLNQQRLLGLLCDCTFVVNGVDFKAHKAVLAACSEYFKMLFVDQKDVVHLDISNAAGLEQVLEFMYTAKLSLSLENVDDVLAVASFLQMQEIASACVTLKSLSAAPGSSAEAPAAPPPAAAPGKAAEEPPTGMPEDPHLEDPSPGEVRKSPPSGPSKTKPAAVKIPAEVELEGREEEEDSPSEAEGPVAPEESKSGSTDSGQENAGEARLLRSGTYGNRTKSKAYGSVTHKCEDCGKEFTHTSNFKRHIRIHTKGKLFSCRKCSKAFSDPAACKAHEKMHRYGRVESVKILPKRGSEGGVAAFVDFVDIKSAQKAHNSVNKMGDRDLRTDYNEPGTIPSAARGLDDTVSIASRSREVSGFRGGGGGPTYGPPLSLHAREGRYERRLDGASDTRERGYEHSAYGHHERGTGGFDRTRHYDQDYYRDPRERTLAHGIYYSSRSRSPSRFDAHDPRYEPRAREQFTLPSVVHRDIYRDDLTREVRGRRPERSYQHSRSRSPHSSQSRTQSPQRLASQASRPTRSPSGSGSRSRSSSSDSISSSSSTSSDSSDSSSSSSDESPARSVQSTAVPAPTSQLLPSLEKDEPRKSFGIKVQNLPVRSTDTSLKDGLFHEFKKYGKVTSVQIHGASEERYGLVFFRQQEDQEKALNASKGKLFFGMQIEVTAWIGPETESENEFRPLDERIDEFHPKATRTLFIGNLEKTTTYHDLRNIFQRFGGIVDIDIKKVNGVPQYAFLQYCDITSVCKAIKKMDGEYLGNNRLKLGFGKSMPTNCVWLDGLSTNVTDQYLTRHFCRYGPVVKVVFDRLKGMALVLYNEIEYAQAAVKETKGRKISGNKIKVDFANRESQLAFYQSMEKTGQDIRDFYEMLAERRDERRGSYDYAADRTYYEAARTPGSYPEDPRREYPARGREFYADWDPYQADYYDPRYYDDLREY